MNQRSGRPPGRGSRQRPRGPDPVRQTAFDVLRAVAERDAYANLLLPSLLRERGLSGRDAALATELTYGTLRGQGTYDAVLGLCSDRGIDAIDPPLLDVLRLGAHQLLRTRIPPHAAVATTVELARSAAGHATAGFANAVLRKVTTRDVDAWLAIAAPSADSDLTGHLAVTYSHPRWIVSAMRDAIGGDLDETRRLLAADNERPRLTLVAKPGRFARDDLIKAGAAPGRYSPYAAYLSDGDPSEVPGVADGRAAVQDEGSQMVALALAGEPLDGSDRHWLDLCAGPGGKASLLAGLAAQRGAHLLAADALAHRAGLVRNALGLRSAPDQAATAGVVIADGTRPAWRAGTFDRVLADVPCTGLGALRRRPEARWRRTPGSVAELGQLQRALLSAALDAVRPGGLVAYVTCSPHIAETRIVVEDVLRQRADAERADAVAAVRRAGPVEELGDGPYAQFWPHRHGTDAMFLALLRRR